MSSTEALPTAVTKFEKISSGGARFFKRLG
jgi:hypothetical protein